MTPAVNLDLDCILEKRGYVIQKKADIMMTTLDEFPLEDNKRQTTMIACGLGVIESNYVGLYDIRVRDTYRRQGLATQLCREIMQVGKSQGAKEAYLQVMAMNSNAISLYEKLGFEKNSTIPLT